MHLIEILHFMIDCQTIDHDYYNIKSTHYDRTKRVTSWRITRNTNSQPMCGYCFKRCFDPSPIGKKSLKKCKNWRGSNNFNFYTYVMMERY